MRSKVTPTSRRCRLCREQLITDELVPRHDHLAPLDVHVRCTRAFLREAAFQFFLVAWEADDHDAAGRWLKVREDVIALDPPAHVTMLLASLDRPEPAP